MDRPRPTTRPNSSSLSSLLTAHPPARIALLGALGLATLSSIPASASDGVLEINQTCAVQTGCFAGDTAGLPVTISASGSYRLTSNLVVSNANTNGIQISVDEVGIDLNNFSIRGPVVCSGTPLTCTPVGTGSGVAANLNAGISVRDGSIRGMGSYGVSLGEQSEVSGVRARSNGITGIDVSVGSTVTGNAAYQNGGNGIGSRNGSTLSGNAAYQNRSAGISAANGVTVSGNSVYLNGGDGIVTGTGVVVSGNTAYDNEGDGIQTNSGATVIGNSVRLNTGFGLNLSSQSGYRENAVSSNTAGTVAGTATNLGDNVCSEAAGTTTACP